MLVRLRSHAEQRLQELGTTTEEIILAVTDGESFPAKYGRTGFRRNSSFDGTWRGKEYATKQLEVIAVWEDETAVWEDETNEA